MSDSSLSPEIRRGLAIQSLLTRAYVAIMGLGFGFGLYMFKTHSLQDNVIDLIAESLIILLASKFQTSAIVIDYHITDIRIMNIFFSGEWWR
jgi:hypothetical protein